MLEQNTEHGQEEDGRVFDRRFKYAVCACAVVECVAFLIVFYYKYYHRDI